jgi:hypothetical protein
LIDDVRIYPRALDATEVSALANETPERNLRNQWFFRHSGNPSPDTGAWDGDEDGDAFNATLEHALGGNPTVANREIAPALKHGETKQFIFNRRREGIAASAYIPEISATLAANSWSPLADPAVIPHPTLPGFDQVTVTVPEAERGFVRLRVEP